MYTGHTPEELLKLEDHIARVTTSKQKGAHPAMPQSSSTQGLQSQLHWGRRPHSLKKLV
jgi:hypothetical protein